MLGNFRLLNGRVESNTNGLIGMVGLVSGVRNVFLLDSGMSANFMSLEFAK